MQSVFILYLLLFYALSIMTSNGGEHLPDKSYVGFLLSEIVAIIQC